MNKYELVVLVDATKSQEEKETVIREVTDTITKCDGKLINRQVWLERQKMAFRIKRCSEATYYLLNMEGERSVLPKLQQALRLNEKVLRYLTIAAV